MVFVALRIEDWTSGLVNRLGQSAVVTVIASPLAFALRGNRNRTCNRAWVIASVILLLPLSTLLAAQESPQSASPVAATFEVATIKLSKPDAQGNTFRVRGHRFETRNTSLSDLISFAYGLHEKQITGAPPWVQADKYDLTAQSDAEGQSIEMLWRGMLQKYLVECFKLKFHRDTQELPLYVLTIGGTGPKLTKSKGDPNGIPALSVTLGATNAANPNLGAVAATNANMGDLARVMQRLVLEWPVVDQTGILGRYDFGLNWTPDDSQFGDTRAKIPTPTDSANAPPDLFTAIQEQVGLKLDVLSAPSEILIIDSVEKPSETDARETRDRRDVSPVLHRSWNVGGLGHHLDTLTHFPARTPFPRPFHVTDNLY
jgi:uncharacterized protein (TIGR03435 family)